MQDSILVFTRQEPVALMAGLAHRPSRTQDSPDGQLQDASLPEHLMQKRTLKNWSIRHMLLFRIRAANHVYSEICATR